MKLNVEKARIALEHRRHRLLTSWKSNQDQENELLQTDPDDGEELSTRQNMAQLADRISEHEIHQLGEVLAAIDRIHNGYYGLCTQCGEPISSRRLEVLPEARLCAPCAGINKPESH